MADRDFVVKNGLRTVGNTIVANSSQISLNSNVVIDSAASLSANGSVGSAGQYLISNGSGVYWATVSVGTNAAAAFVWTNTHTFSANLTLGAGLIANGGVGTAGQVLTSNGSTGSPYWSSVAGVNTSAPYVWTNNHTFSGSITTNGRLIIDNIVTANGSNGTAGQVLTSNTTGVYWSTITPGTGTVTSVASGSGLTGGPVTSSGTLSVLANTGIVANSTGVFVSNTYVNTSADFTINGAITFSNVITYNSNAVFTKSISANGGFGTAGQALLSGGGTTNNYWSAVTTSVSVTANQLSASYSGANPTLGLVTLSNVVAGAYTLTTITVDSFGRIAGIANGTAAGGGTVTQVDTGAGLIVTGGDDSNTITGTGTISLANVGSNTTYGSAGLVSINVDGYGRVTGATTATYLTTSSAASTYAPLASPTFTGTVTLPSATSIGSVSSTELGYLDGVTSAIQTQINGLISGVTAGDGLSGGGSSGDVTLNVGAGNGITVSTDTIAVTAANGISVTTGGVKVANADNTLAVTSSGVFVNTSSLLATTGNFSKSSGTTTFANTITLARGSGGSGGIEGGQIHFEKPSSSTTLTSNVAIDVYGNLIRFFEEQVSATGRGYYLDLRYAASSSCSAIVVTPTATDTTTTDYPIGTILCFGGKDGLSTGGDPSINMNDTALPRTNQFGLVAGTGTLLDGTWRSRGVSSTRVTGDVCSGYTYYYWYLIQRTA